MSPPDVPPIKCAETDCPGHLELREKPEAWRGDSLWVYRCDQNGCSGVLAAHPDGRPVGVPANKEIREARKQCHRAFDRLWQYPREIYPRLSDEVAGYLRSKMRRHAYEFMAHKLGVPQQDVHMGAMTDVAFMRRFYETARNASAAEVHEWWVSERNPSQKAGSHKF